MILRDYADRLDLLGGDTTEHKRLRAIEWLGERWLLHPLNAPRKATYNDRGLLENTTCLN